MLEHCMPLIPAVAIMFIASFLLSYFINETISIRKNITANHHKFYMSLFMAFQMGLVELLMHYYYMGVSHIYLLFILIIGIAYSGYQLYTLRFLDDRQFLLAMIEHHENAIAMVDAYEKYYQTNNRVLKNLMDNIKTTQRQEIDLMYKLLDKK